MRILIIFAIIAQITSTHAASAARLKVDDSTRCAVASKIMSAATENNHNLSRLIAYVKKSLISLDKRLTPKKQSIIGGLDDQQRIQLVVQVSRFCDTHPDQSILMATSEIYKAQAAARMYLGRK